MKAYKHNQHKRERMREERRRYRQSHKTYSLSFTNREAKKLAVQAKKINRSIPVFIKHVLEAHEKHPGYIGYTKEHLAMLIAEIKKVGGTINQLIKHIHSVRRMSYKDIERLQDMLSEMCAYIETSMKHPKDIQVLIAQFLLQHPEKKEALLNHIKNHNHDTEV